MANKKEFTINRYEISPKMALPSQNKVLIIDPAYVT
jgi:hypothetical protein